MARRGVPDLLRLRYLIATWHDTEEETDRTRGTQDIGPLAAARMGFLTNLLSPKMTLFFLALFTQIIRPETPMIQAFYGLTMVGL